MRDEENAKTIYHPEQSGDSESASGEHHHGIRLYNEHDLHPNVCYRLQRQFVKEGAVVFEQESSHELGQLKRRVSALISQTKPL